MILLSTIAMSLGLVSMSATLQPMAFTYHGLISKDELQTIREFGQDYYDEEGRMTSHPGAGLTLRWDYMQLTSIYFRNSFNRHAGAVMGGPKVSFTKYFTLGAVAGAYFREFIPGMKIPFSYHNESIEIAPMIMATGSVAIKIYKTLYFEVNAGSNYVLNFFTPGLRADF